MLSFQLMKKRKRNNMGVPAKKNTYLSQLSAQGADLKATERTMSGRNASADTAVFPHSASFTVEHVPYALLSESF